MREDSFARIFHQILLGILLEPAYDFLIILVKPSDIGFSSFNRLFNSSALLQFIIVKVLQSLKLVPIGEFLR